MPNEASEEFNPYLGMYLGETWWKLGSNISRALFGSQKAQQNYCISWAKSIQEKLKHDEMSESVDAISSANLYEAANTIMSLLKKKYNSESIARDVSRLTEGANEEKITDDGQYLNSEEPPNVFWAIEYSILFNDLAKPSKNKGKGWLNAVAICEDPECKEFFVKGRKDQRFHTAGCRTRTANREAYHKIVESKLHSKKGRRRRS